MDIGTVDAEIADEVSAALQFARSSPFPPSADAFADVYGDRFANA